MHCTVLAERRIVADYKTESEVLLGAGTHRRCLFRRKSISVEVADSESPYRALHFAC